MDQHCWGCRKRRVVCDLGKPGCVKCKRVGVECPGYGEKKPLQWLEVGRVKCRERKKKQPRVIVRAIVEGEDEEAATNSKKTAVSTVRKERALAHRPKVKVQVKVEADIELFEEAVPQLGLKDETTDIVQAVFYYNKTLYPDLRSCYEMCPSPYVVTVPPEILHHLPAAIRHSMVTLSLCYRLHRQEVTGEIAWPKILVHRGGALQDLNKTIGQCSMQVSKKHMTRKQTDMIDTIITCVIIFVCVEIAYCASMEWRHHIEAMSGMIAMRGGLTRLWQDSPLIRSSLVHFVLIQNFSSSTSPVTPQTLLKPFNQLLSVPEEMHEDIFPFCLCPFPLFESIAFINRLRVQVAQDITNTTASRNAAEALLMRIDSFSITDWAVSQSDFVETLELVANIYHCAVMLYCMLSLENVLPSTLPLKKFHRVYGDRMLRLLSRALSKGSRTHYFITWPVVVAGVEAGRREPGTQALVDGYLTSMSDQSGTCSASIARKALRSFWRSGGTQWDECFCIPFAFQS